MRSLLLLVALLLPAQSWAFTYSTVCEGSSVSVTTTTTCGPVTLSAGQLAAVWLGWESNGTATISTITSDQSDTCVVATATLKYNSGSLGAPAIEGGYCLSAVGGSTTFTITLSAAAEYKIARIDIVTPSGTAAYQTAPTGGEATTGTTLTSGTFSTGTGEYVVGFGKLYNAYDCSSPLVGGNAGTLRGDTTLVAACLFDYTTASPITGGTVGVTQSTSNRWTIGAMAFTESGGGGGATPRNLTLMGVGN